MGCGASGQCASGKAKAKQADAVEPRVASDPPKVASAESPVDKPAPANSSTSEPPPPSEPVAAVPVIVVQEVLAVKQDAACQEHAVVVESGNAFLADSQIVKLHSAVRWDKSNDEILALIEELGVTMPNALASADPKNGNRCLNIASQNGHASLVEFLLQNGADVNAQNGKGQTALHMAVEYDFYFVSQTLLGHGADGTITNVDGHEALLGIDGGKTGSDAYDAPLNILKAANTKEQFDVAFVALEVAEPSSLDKASLVQVGMAKKRVQKDNWDAARFKELMQRL